MTKILILGNGFLGNRLYNYFRDNREDVILSDERIGPVTTYKEIKNLINKHNPESILTNFSCLKYISSLAWVRRNPCKIPLKFPIDHSIDSELGIFQELNCRVNNYIIYHYQGIVR